MDAETDRRQYDMTRFEDLMFDRGEASFQRSLHRNGNPRAAEYGRLQTT